MFVVPTATPVTTPVDALMVATDGLLLTQVPPGAIFVSVELPPTHTVVVPPMAEIGLTVNDLVELQPSAV